MDDPASAVAETPRLTRRKLLRYQLPTFCGLLVAAYVAAPLFEGAGEQSLRGGGDEEVALSYSGRQLMNSSNGGVVCGLDGVTEDQACCEPSGGAISLSGFMSGQKVCNADGSCDAGTCCGSLDTGFGVILYLVIMLYTFLGLAVVCDDYFCESLDLISEKLNLSPDVAGATFMAAGSSAPELFTAVVTVLITGGSEGLGAIVGSAVFNIMVICGVTAKFAGQVLKIWWYPLARDAMVYVISVIMMLLVLIKRNDEKTYTVESWEAAVLVLGYFFYIILMKKNAAIADFVERKFEKKQIHPKVGAGFSDVKEAGGLGGIAAAAASLAGPANPNTAEVDKAKKGLAGAFGAPQPAPASDDHHHIKLAHEVAPGEHEHDARLYVNPRLNPVFHAAHHHGIHDRRVESRDSVVVTVGTAIRINDLRNRLMAKKRKKEEEAANKMRTEQEPEQVPEPPEPKAPTEEEKAAEKAQDEEGDGGTLDKFLEIVSKPLEIAMELTIPDCREESKENLYLVTFTMSIIWIGVLSYLMVDFAARAGCVLGVPGILMGLVVIAAGTSVPDALSSVLVAKNGQGDMAVANVLGSNVFNIFLGLGLPWLIKTLSMGKPLELPPGENIVVPVVILLAYVVVFIAIIAASGWAMRPKTGDWLFAAHIVFVIWNILTMLPAGDPIIAL